MGFFAITCSEDNDFDDGWCCNPHSWCEFFHYVLFQIVFGTLFWWCLFTFVGDRIKRNLIKTIRYEGVACPATVIDKHTTPRCYGCCRYTQQSVRVEFFNLLGLGKVTKDIKVSKDLYAKIDRIPCDLVVFHLSEYPRSAILDDPAMEQKYSSNVKVFFLWTACLVHLVAVVMSFVWYSRTYDSMEEGFVKVFHMHVIQLIIASVCWAYAAQQAGRHEDSILREECSRSDIKTQSINDFSYRQGLLEMK